MRQLLPAFSTVDVSSLSQQLFTFWYVVNLQSFLLVQIDLFFYSWCEKLMILTISYFTEVLKINFKLNLTYKPIRLRNKSNRNCQRNVLRITVDTRRQGTPCEIQTLTYNNGCLPQFLGTIFISFILCRVSSVITPCLMIHLVRSSTVLSNRFSSQSFSW